MTQDEQMRAKVRMISDQANAALEHTIAENLKAFERLAQTGQPFDQRDRDLIKITLLVSLGNFRLGD